LAKTKPGDKKDFHVWLKAIAGVAGADTPAKLERLLQNQACHCTTDNAEEWLSGTTQPSYEKERDIIKAFYAALPEVDVWEEYRLFVKGEPFFQGQRQRASQMDASLAQMLKESGGLPPGLLD